MNGHRQSEGGEPFCARLRNHIGESAPVTSAEETESTLTMPDFCSQSAAASGFGSEREVLIRSDWLHFASTRLHSQSHTERVQEATKPPSASMDVTQRVSEL